MTKVILESRDDGNPIIQLSWLDSDEYNIILTYSIVPKVWVNLCLILLFFVVLLVLQSSQRIFIQKY